MFHLYTDDARRVLSVAQRHAERYQHDNVGIEHLLVALIEYGRGPAEEAFFALDVTPGEAWARWEALFGPPVDTDRAEQPARRLQYTSGASRAMGLCLNEKRHLRHNYVGSEHILLALLRQLDDPWAEPEIASEFLERLRTTPSSLRKALVARIRVDL